MEIDAAKAEVLERINKIVGAKVSEDDLTFSQKQALASIAQALRQLIIVKQMLMVGQTKQSSFIFRITKGLRKNEENDEVSNYLRQIDEMQKFLDAKIEELANKVVEEKHKLIVIVEEPPIKEKTDVNIVQPLKCTNCGAGLKVVSSNLAECEYCRMKYTMANYLSMLKTSIQKI